MQILTMEAMGLLLLDPRGADAGLQAPTAHTLESPSWSPATLVYLSHLDKAPGLSWGSPHVQAGKRVLKIPISSSDLAQF